MQQKKLLNMTGFCIAVIAGLSLLLGAAVQGLFNLGNFTQGFLSGSLLFFCIGGLSFMAWRAAGKGKALARIMLVAFAIRLLLGVFLVWSLPRFGYEQEVQQAGYVFNDAYRRDHQAWALAQSDQSLTQAFSDEYSTDQYGGMLALSAAVYRFLSPDAHRPLLMMMIAAGAMVLGLPFFFSTVQRQFGWKIATMGSWFLALYPEGVLLGSSQMREPFYILFITVIFWAGTSWLDRKNLKWAIPAFIVSMVGLWLFSFRVALPVFGVVLLWIWVVESGRLEKRWLKYVGWGAVALGSAVILLLFRDWMREVVRWDMYLTVRWSGMVQAQLENIPKNLHLPFIVVYGLLQPLLPAAITASGPWIWRGLAIFRSLGWYVLLPLLIYVVIRLWKAAPKEKRRWLFIMVVVVFTWTLIASVRAGGDQWDNPRYRTIFLPWMAVLAGWGLNFARVHKDRWLTRIFLIEGVFVVFLLMWYSRRYWSVDLHLSLPEAAIMALAASLLILIVGWIRDRKHPNPALTSEGE